MQASDLYDRLAIPGLDFIPEMGANLSIADGIATGSIPVYVLPDNVPELAEKFVVRLLKVELINGDMGNPNFSPKLGSAVAADVYIAANQDPHGAFAIYSSDPLAISGGQTILVEEKANFLVQLVLDRKGNWLLILRKAGVLV